MLSPPPSPFPPDRTFLRSFSLLRRAMACSRSRPVFAENLLPRKKRAAFSSGRCQVRSPGNSSTGFFSLSKSEFSRFCEARIGRFPGTRRCFPLISGLLERLFFLLSDADTRARSGESFSQWSLLVLPVCLSRRISFPKRVFSRATDLQSSRRCSLRGPALSTRNTFSGRWETLAGECKFPPIPIVSAMPATMNAATD